MSDDKKADEQHKQQIKHTRITILISIVGIGVMIFLAYDDEIISFLREIANTSYRTEAPQITFTPEATQTPIVQENIPMTNEARNITIQAIEILDDYLNGILDSRETSRKLGELPQFRCDSSVSASILYIRMMMLNGHTEEQLEQIRTSRNRLAERLDSP